MCIFFLLFSLSYNAQLHQGFLISVDFNHSGHSSLDIHHPMPCGGRHRMEGYRIAPETRGSTNPVPSRAGAAWLSLLQFWDCHAASWWPCTSAAQHSAPLPPVSTRLLAPVQLLILCNPKGWLLVEFISMLHLWSLWCTTDSVCNASFSTTSLKFMNINLNLILFLRSALHQVQI